MSTLSLRLPSSLHKMAKEMARREGASINQLITSALAEKISALAAEEYLAARAARADQGKFERVMAKVKKRPPLPGDEM